MQITFALEKQANKLLEASCELVERLASTKVVQRDDQVLGISHHVNDLE